MNLNNCFTTKDYLHVNVLSQTTIHFTSHKAAAAYERLNRSAVPIRVPNSESRCHQGTIVVNSVGIFSRCSPVSPFSSNQHSPLSIPPLCHIIFSFMHFMSTFTSLMVKKHSLFDILPVYNLAGWFRVGDIQPFEFEGQFTSFII